MSKNIIVVGAGFSGLKLAKLLRCSNNQDLNVTLIADNDVFVFFPLVPDYITGKIKSLSSFTTDIQLYCTKLGVKCITGKCVELDVGQKEIVMAEGDRIKYDECILCTGKANSNNHSRIWEFLGSLVDKRGIYKTGQMGLAEFEIMSALTEAGVNVKIVNYSRYKDLSGHWLRSTLSINGMDNRLIEVCNYIIENSVEGDKDLRTETRVNSDEIIKEIVVIGAALNEYDGKYPSAQRSSQNAHIVSYYVSKRRQESPELKQEVYKKLEQYKSRGEMIFINSENALIWLGGRARGKATLDGLMASFLRRLFYRLEFWLYYKAGGAPVLLCKLINRTRIYSVL